MHKIHFNSKTQIQILVEPVLVFFAKSSEYDGKRFFPNAGGGENRGDIDEQGVLFYRGVGEQLVTDEVVCKFGEASQD